MFTKLTELSPVALTALGALDAVDNEPTPAAIEVAARDAIDYYSKQRPYYRIAEVVGDGVQRRFVLLDEIVGWSDGACSLGSMWIVRNPDADDEEASEIPESDWRVYQSAAGSLALQLRVAVPDGYTLRMEWGCAHTLDELDDATETTIPERDKHSVLLLVVAALAEWVSRHLSDRSNMTLGIDQVNHESVAGRWRKHAELLRQQADDRLAPKLSSGALGTSIEWEPKSRFGRARISH